jgi:hypothetical protein
MPSTRLNRSRGRTLRLTTRRRLLGVLTNEAISPLPAYDSTSVIRKFVSATIAPGGAGKSSLVIVEVLEMAAGKPLLLEVARAPLRV